MLDADHGTFIGGLVVGGATLNGTEICPEPDGVEIVDVAVFQGPEDKPRAFSSYYPDGLSQFFDEIEYAVADAKARHDVRMFNMSLNIQHQATPDHYGVYATPARRYRGGQQRDILCFCRRHDDARFSS